MSLPSGDALARAIESRALYRIETFRETGTLYVSNSTLSAVARCDTKALLTAMGYVGREESVKMRLGSDAHVGIAIYRKGGTAADAIAEVERRYRAWSEETIERLFDPDYAANVKRIYGWENVARVLTVYFRDHAPRYPFRFYPELVEVPFAVPLDTTCARCGIEQAEHTVNGMAATYGGEWARHDWQPAIVACGKLDALVEDTPGVWYVDDVKTTGNLDARFAKQFVNDSQFSHYTWGVAEHLVREVAGGVVTAIEWSRMPVVKLTAKGVAQKCRTHGVLVDECGDLHIECKVIGPLLRTPTTIARWKVAALELARDLKGIYEACKTVEDIPRVTRQFGTFRHECPYCPALEWCGGDLVARYLDSVMEWKPWEGIQ